MDIDSFATHIYSLKFAADDIIVHMTIYVVKSVMTGMVSTKPRDYPTPIDSMQPSKRSSCALRDLFSQQSTERSCDGTGVFIDISRPHDGHGSFRVH